jgi:hypothetical protein
MTKKIITLIAISAMMLMVAGCAKSRKAGGQMDTPEIHTEQGMKYIEAGEITKAEEEFNLAISLDKKFAAAYAGRALVFGERGRIEMDKKAKEKLFDKAFDDIDKAKDLNKKLPAAWLSHGMVITMQHMADNDKDWVEDAIKQYDHVINKLDKNSAEAYYRKGWTLKYAYQFRDAADQFKKVLDMNGAFTAEADREWKIMQDIERAAPGSKVGMKIALIDKISRADVAALFISELDLVRLIEKKRPKNYDTDFKAPEDTRTLAGDSVVKVEPMKDIADHWARNFIQEIVSLQVRGLEPYANHTFKPDELITRGEYAFMLEDALIAILREEALATKHVGSTTSRFPDVHPGAPYYNAICNMVDKNIMNANISSEFDAKKSVSGAEALLAIRALKELKK